MDKPYIQVFYVDESATLWQFQQVWQEGMTLEQALHQSGLAQAFPDLDWATLGLGVFGQKASLNQLLLPFDRIEICRPLVFDPMASRRRRAAHKQKQRKQPAPVRKLKKVREGADTRADSFRRIQP